MAVIALLSTWIDAQPVEHWDAASTGGLTPRLRLLDGAGPTGQVFFQVAATPDGEEQWSVPARLEDHPVLDQHLVPEHALTAQDLPDEILARGEIWLRAVADGNVLALARVATAAPAG